MLLRIQTSSALRHASRNFRSSHHPWSHPRSPRTVSLHRRREKRIAGPLTPLPGGFSLTRSPSPTPHRLSLQPSSGGFQSFSSSSGGSRKHRRPKMSRASPQEEKRPEEDRTDPARTTSPRQQLRRPTLSESKYYGEAFTSSAAESGTQGSNGDAAAGVQVGMKRGHSSEHWDRRKKSKRHFVHPSQPGKSQSGAPGAMPEKGGNHRRTWEKMEPDPRYEGTRKRKVAIFLAYKSVPTLPSFPPSSRLSLCPFHR